MFCGNCGKEIKNPAAKFCPECGSPVASEQPQAEQMTSVQPEPEIQDFTYIEPELNEVELIPPDPAVFEEAEENQQETRVFHPEEVRAAEESEKQTADINRQGSVNRQEPEPAEYGRDEQSYEWSYENQQQYGQQQNNNRQYNEWQEQPTAATRPSASKKRGWWTAIGITAGVIILLICCAVGVVVMKNRQSTDRDSDQLAAAETAEPAETGVAEEEAVTEAAAATETAAESQTEAAVETEAPTATPVPATETPTEAASEPESTPIVYVVRQLTGMTATATSQLEDYESKSYGASNLFDGSLSTAYVEGVDGVGTGEQITIDLDKTSCIDSIVWYPGYQISEDLLAKNGYPTALTFYFSDGTSVTSQVTGSLSVGTSVTVDVPDSTQTSWIRVEITSAVAGSTYEDTCISEMEIYGYEIEE